MGKINNNKTAISNKGSETNKRKLTKASTPRSDDSKSNVKKKPSAHLKPYNSCKKKDISNVIKNEHQFISNLFEVLDLARLNQGRRNESDEEENSDSMQFADIPEQKVFKKQTQKKGSSQVNMKNKSFPQTIEGLEQELAELKGTPMTYQKNLRKKGLKSRLLKKKKKEQLKLKKKTTLKSSKKNKLTANGLPKTKQILNSDGNVVANKFDFADTDIKKENKKKGAINNEMNASHSTHTDNGYVKNEINSFTNSPIKKDNNTSGNIKLEPNSDIKTTSKPIFNKDNKMVFSKVYVSENHKKPNKSTKKNTKKLLEKLREENKKISELEKEDQDKAVSLKEKQKWAAALKRASGEKVKDDPELLRKSISREQNKKNRSHKKWKARIDHVEKEKEGKQKKRKENIQARKTDKKKKKMKKAIKKGSYVPL